MAKKNKGSEGSVAQGENTGNTVSIVRPEMEAGQRKSDFARSIIRANFVALTGGDAVDATRGAVVGYLCEKTGMARALARTYIKENIQRVTKALKKEADASQD